MKNTPIKPLALILALAMAGVMAGCSADSEDTSASTSASASADDSSDDSTTIGEESTVTGLFTSLDGDTLTLELIDMDSIPEDDGGERPDGSIPEGGPDGSMPEGEPGGGGGGEPDGDGERGDMGEMPDGSMPEGERGGMGGFEGTGETMSITLTADTAIVGVDGEALSTDELDAGTMLQVQLAQDGITAVAITVMQAMGDGNNMGGDAPS